MNLVIDSRESKLKKFFTSSDKKIPISFQGLDIGDIQIVSQCDNTIQYIIERKSISDLYSSINDGRYREQKARLLGCVSKNRIAYIIEGNILDTSLKLSALQRKIVQAAIVNMSLRDNITIYRTNNSVETGMFIEIIYKKVMENPTWLLESASAPVPVGSSINSEQPSYNHLVKTVKKDNMTPLICQKVQMAQIPGVSHSMADKILEQFKSIPHLIAQYNLLENEEDKMKMLQNIQVSEKRKLGKVLSNRIYDFLFIND